MMKDNRKEPYCNLNDCDKECKDHRANMTKMAGMSKLLWVLLIAVLGSGLWSNKALSDHDEKDEQYYQTTKYNSQFITEQKEINKEMLRALHSIELGVQRVENKVDNHLKDK